MKKVANQEIKFTVETKAVDYTIGKADGQDNYEFVLKGTSAASANPSEAKANPGSTIYVTNVTSKEGGTPAAITSSDSILKVTYEDYNDNNKIKEVTVNALAPIQERYKEIRYTSELEEILKDGGERANAIAEKTMKRVREHFGLGL